MEDFQKNFLKARIFSNTVHIYGGFPEKYFESENIQ